MAPPGPPARVGSRRPTRDVVEHAAPRQQARILEHDGGRAAGAQLALDLAVQAGERAQQRRLARARAAEQRDELAGRDVQVDPVEHDVCLRETSETLAALRDSGGFAINVLAEDQRDLADRFARAASDAVWEGVAHELAPTGHPLLDGTLATLECAVHDEADGGDHRIVIGRVLSARLADEPFWPLLFAESRYHGIGEELTR